MHKLLISTIIQKDSVYSRVFKQQKFHLRMIQLQLVLFSIANRFNQLARIINMILHQLLSKHRQDVSTRQVERRANR